MKKGVPFRKQKFKPKMRFRRGLWECYCSWCGATGRTIQEAYRAWKMELGPTDKSI